MNNQQPPTREQIAEAIDTWWDGTDPDGVMAEDVEALTADLLALFPQPTPSAEPEVDVCFYCRGAGYYDGGDMRDDEPCNACRGTGLAEPVSIADMAPGTRFRDSDGWWTVHGAYSGEAWAAADEGGTRDLHAFDQSTIRDVTSPKGVQ